MNCNGHMGKHMVEDIYLPLFGMFDLCVISLEKPVLNVL